MQEFETAFCEPMEILEQSFLTNNKRQPSKFDLTYTPAVEECSIEEEPSVATTTVRGEEKEPIRQQTSHTKENAVPKKRRKRDMFRNLFRKLRP
mmetsp:Transcript_9016/g.14034  ORF Transcript_9016/g.14034 Transcript_9016/m.14034 type:complete len:94 (+) Transcript_9016:857-1138(+)